MLNRLFRIENLKFKYFWYTLEWRIIATAIDFSVIYLWTGQLKQATGVTITLVVLKSTFFYFWRKHRQ